MNETRWRRLGVLLAVLVVLLAAGCGRKSFWVQRYPEFYTPEIKTVAVLPFDNRTQQIGVGTTFAEYLASDLARNGTYRVVGPRDLRPILGGKALEAAPHADRKALADALGKTGGIQAFITGTVLAYSAFTSAYADWDYAYGYYYRRDYWGWAWEYGWPHYTFATRAHVGVAASMTRVSDGSVLYGTPVPVQAAVGVERYTPPDPERVVMEAADRAAARLVRRFAVVPVKVRVDRKEALQTAAGRSGNLWRFQKTFRPTDETMYVVVRLPRAAERNTFRVTITPKGEERAVVAERTFAWSPEVHARGLAFSPREIAAAAGAGTYRVRFYAEGEQVMKRSFKIEE